MTDVHGSETTFRKFVNSGKFYGVDVLVLGGDVAGKMVVPILDFGGGHYRATIQSMTHELEGGEAVGETSRSAPASWARTRRSSPRTNTTPW